MSARRLGNPESCCLIGIFDAIRDETVLSLRVITRLCVALMFLALAGVAHAAQVTYYHTDGLGSVVMESNEAGQVTYSREYRPYGEQALGSAKDGPGFAGHVADTDTGLTYMQQRYYDPQIGRFLSVDPVTADANLGANFNRYWYANNNPYRFADPDGRLAQAIEGPIIVAGFVATVYYLSLSPEEKQKFANGMARKAEQTWKAITHKSELPVADNGKVPNEGEGRRRKNRIPDRGEPGTIRHNPPGTTGKEYGEDGWVETEWNDGHGPDAPDGEQDDHVHDHIPNPYHPEGRPTRQPGRQPTPEERERFKPKPKPEQ